MAPYRRWLDPLLQEAHAQAEQENDPRKRLHASLALLPVDSGQVEYLFGRLLQAQPQEVIVIRGALSDHKQDLTERLWTLLGNPKNDQDQRFRAACALAALAPDDPRWEQAAGDVATTLIIQKPFVIAQWTDALRGAGKWLIPPLADFLVDEQRSMAERGVIATVYGTYAAALPAAYSRLEKQLSAWPELYTPVEARVSLARRQASLGVALLVMGRTDRVWPLLRHQPDPTLRSYLIDRAGPGGVDAKVLTGRLEEELEVSVRRAILLSLGEYGLDRLSQDQRLRLVPRLIQLYREDVDPGIHGAAEWLLRQWKREGELKRIDRELMTGKVEGKRRWYVNRLGQTMVVVANAGEFWMGQGNVRHRRMFGRSFALASKEVTVEQYLQYLRYRKARDFFKQSAPTDDCPRLVSWYEAAEYCNWLSKLEGIPENQWCYEPLYKGLFGGFGGSYRDGMKMAPNYLQRTGYRLPTEAEWEYACRAGAGTGYSFGEAVDLRAKYGGRVANSTSRAQAVAMLRPNDNGLFDMYGNVFEWTQRRYDGKADSDRMDDKEDIDFLVIEDRQSYVVRGGWLDRSADRRGYMPTTYSMIGFRPARTFKP
jgi:formylglycine-generating enzyme required for sulfatase activity